MKIRALTTYRCRSCTQLLPFDARTRVPEACLARCQGRCDWVELGPASPAQLERASLPGPVEVDGLPALPALPPAGTGTVRG